MQSRVRIKMCGMTRAEDIQVAAALGVDAIGLIFYPPSPRNVTIAHAKTLLQIIPAFVDVVAVFVDPLPAFVQQVIDELPVQYLQFHGDESASFCQQFNRPYIKAMHATATAAIENTIHEHPHAAAILLDTPSVTARGGSGTAFDWRIIPAQSTTAIMLAGGLDAQNVRLAVSDYAPYAVDVCSGVEALPGRKDVDKMNQFVNALWGKA